MLKAISAILVAGLTVAGCAPMPTGPRPTTTPTTTSAGQARPQVSAADEARASTAARRFVSVVRTVEPVAERQCRARAPELNCDFMIVVDDRPGQPVNAYQTLNSSGRPIIAFTLAMIGDVRNADELAFVMSHEAAHHISRHLARQRVNSTAGATIFGQLANAAGVGGAGVQLATRVGANVGARTYSKDFELEADYLGAQIAQAAGYDALNGAEYFTRIPDPGDRFLGTHPPNANRMATVRRAITGR